MYLTRRTQILLDDARHELLRRRAEATGESVGALIRRAIDQAYDTDADRERVAAERRERALQSFLASPALPVGEWDEVEAEIETMYERGVGASG